MKNLLQKQRSKIALALFFACTTLPHMWCAEQQTRPHNNRIEPLVNNFEPNPQTDPVEGVALEVWDGTLPRRTSMRVASRHNEVIDALKALENKQNEVAISIKALQASAKKIPERYPSNCIQISLCLTPFIFVASAGSLVLLITHLLAESIDS